MKRLHKCGLAIALVVTLLIGILCLIPKEYVRVGRLQALPEPGQCIAAHIKVAQGEPANLHVSCTPPGAIQVIVNVGQVEVREVMPLMIAIRFQDRWQVLFWAGGLKHVSTEELY